MFLRDFCKVFLSFGGVFQAYISKKSTVAILGGGMYYFKGISESHSEQDSTGERFSAGARAGPQQIPQIWPGKEKDRGAENITIFSRGLYGISFPCRGRAPVNP